jgi:hypothetical protein
MALQHLRSNTANKRPDPTAMADGQLAINTPAVNPGLFFKDAAGALVKVGPVHVGTSAPNASPASGGTAGNSVGEQWLDTTGGTYVFKVWDGSAWRSEAGEFVNTTGDVMTGALGIIAGSAGSPGLYFSGDPNTGLYSPGADQVAISTNGTGRLFVDASGSISVGEANSQGYRFNINAGGSSTTPLANDALRLASSGSGADVNINFTDSVANNAYIGMVGGTLYFNTNGSERLRLDTSGRLGLGTSSPQSSARLHVYATGDYTDESAPFTVGDSTAGGMRLFFGINNTSNYGYIGSVESNTAYRSLVFQPGGGNVGIGTASVADRLHIEGSDVGVRVTNTNSSGVSRISLFNDLGSQGQIFLNGSARSQWGGAGAMTIWQGASSPLLFATNDTERARIDSSGRFGLGTSAPSALKLHSNHGALSSGSTDVLNLFSAQSFDNLGAGNPVLLRLNAGMGATPTGTLLEAFSGYQSATAGTRYYITAEYHPGSNAIRGDKPFISTEFGDTWTSANTGRSQFVMHNVSVINGTLADGVNSLCSYSTTLKPTWSGGTPGYRTATGYEAVIAANNPSAISTAFYADVTGANSNWGVYVNNGKSYFKDTLLVNATSVAGVATARSYMFSSVAANSNLSTYANQNCTLHARFEPTTNNEGASSALVLQLENMAGTIKPQLLRGYNSSDGLVLNADYRGALTNFGNSYGAVSDLKLKTEIVDAASAWQDIKAIRVRKYKIKTEVQELGDNAESYLGVVAQELESSCPGLVVTPADYSETNDENKSVKYSVLYMKAVKALQEAMERIETLEAKVAALEAA